MNYDHTEEADEEGEANINELEEPTSGMIWVILTIILVVTENFG